MGSLRSILEPGEILARAGLQGGPEAGRWKLLVIGYGNELRGDDAAGPLVAEQLGGRRFRDVKVLAVPMLLPEMAVEMGRAERVVMVDASVHCPPGSVRLNPVAGIPRYPVLNCALSPGALRRLCESLSGRRPRTWLLEVPAAHFELGARPSAMALDGVDRAVALVQRWIRRLDSEG